MKNLLHIFKTYKKHRYCVLRGGTRSGKTYASLTFLLLGAISGRFKLASVVAVSVPHLKRGAIRDWEQLLKIYNVKNYDYYSVDRVYKFENSIVEFFSADNSAKLRGAQRDWLFINEVNLLTEQDFNELDVRTREFVLLDFNPVARFWLYDAFEKMNVPISKVECVTTYKDNSFLSPEQIAAIESRRKMHEWWRVYGEGKWGSTQGAAWYNWDITEVQPQKYDVIGVDFGFGTSPTAVVGLQIGTETIIADEIYYGNIDLISLAQLLNAYNCDKYGDSANVDTINLLRKQNVNIYPTTKMALVASYHYLNMHRTLITSRSENIIKEARAVEWADKARGMIRAGVPNHAVDAIRYALHGGKNI